MALYATKFWFFAILGVALRYTRNCAKLKHIPALGPKLPVHRRYKRVRERIFSYAPLTHLFVQLTDIQCNKRNPHKYRFTSSIISAERRRRTVSKQESFFHS